ncbi:MAG: peptide ABC transporter substrate-binding protein [bacterium]|nr:peptide ABC transporter substrate-binding protein [bacterium]
MKTTFKVLWILVVFALIAAACGGDDDSADETTAAPGTTAATTAAPDTTAAPTTTVAPDPDFEGYVLDAGGCDYGGDLEKLSALDEFTIEFDLCGPNPAFLAQIAFGVFGIQPEEHLEATMGATLDNPVGTGPYVLDEWVRGDSVNFSRFDGYYGPQPAHSKLVLKWATESAGRMLELQSGTVDGITFPGTEDLALIESDSNLTLLSKPEPNIFYVGFTNTFTPFDNVDVRKAIAMGIDRSQIVDIFYPDGSEVASHFTPCSVENGCQGESWYDFDATAAKDMLAAAGYPDGFSTSIFYRDVTRGYLPTPGDVAVNIQTQLRENLGIDAEVVQMESAEFIQACSSAGTCDGMHLLGWTGDYPHVTNFLDFHFGEDVTQFGEAHPEVYEPLKEASQLADASAAAPLYEAANNAIKELAPMVPIAHAGAYFGASAAASGSNAPPWGHVQLNLWDNGTDTLVFMQGNEPISLYCADESDGESLRACGQVVEALYSYDIEGNVRPQLATECVPNEALDLWTCSLRQGVSFHDGTTFDANDVIVSFTAGLDASSPLHTGNSGAFDYYSYLWHGLINAPSE